MIMLMWCLACFNYLLGVTFGRTVPNNVAIIDHFGLIRALVRLEYKQKSVYFLSTYPLPHTHTHPHTRTHSHSLFLSDTHNVIHAAFAQWALLQWGSSYLVTSGSFSPHQPGQLSESYSPWCSTLQRHTPPSLVARFWPFTPCRCGQCSQRDLSSRIPESPSLWPCLSVLLSSFFQSGLWHTILSLGVSLQGRGAMPC